MSDLLSSLLGRKPYSLHLGSGIERPGYHRVCLDGDIISHQLPDPQGQQLVEMMNGAYRMGVVAAQAASDSAPDWQLMDTAPKRTAVLIKEADGRMHVASYVDFYDHWMDQMVYLKPIGWMPLPTP